jgi:hypothetical protein
MRKLIAVVLIVGAFAAVPAVAGVGPAKQAHQPTVMETVVQWVRGAMGVPSPARPRVVVPLCGAAIDPTGGCPPASLTH